MSDLSGFQRAWLQAIADAEERARRDDELMLRALRGEAFWGVDKAAGADVVGLVEFLPRGRR